MAAAFEHDKKYGIVIPRIVITSLLACNLQCYGCANGSNLGVDDSFSLDEKIRWIENLAKVFNRHKLHLKDQIFPNTEICLYTNGTLMHRRENIIKELAVFKKKFKVYITVHHNDSNFFKTITKGLFLLKKYDINYEVIGGYFPVLNENPPDFWQILRPMDEDGKIHPVNQPNYKKSWAICSDKSCPQVYKNALWKCSQVAFLEETLKVTNQLNDEEWQPYLKYKPLVLDDNCTIENLVDFFFGT